MGIEDEVNNSLSDNSISEIVGEILSDASPGAMVMVCATLIGALSQALAVGDYDEDFTREVLDGIDHYSKIIVMHVPSQYTDEALEKVSKIDNLFYFINPQNTEGE